MKNHPYLRVLSALAAAAILVFIATSQSGCATKPTAPPVSVPVQPDDPPLPPPDVGSDCAAQIGNMQLAVSVARVGAALLVNGDSKYGPAVKLALVAVDAALAAAKVQCSSGSIDGWAVALAAFDAAMAQLAAGGEALASNAVPPTYARSLELFSARVLADEVEAAEGVIIEDEE